MDREIILIDSDYDQDTAVITKSRVEVLYPKMSGTLVRLPKSTRQYLVPTLSSRNIGFISGSGHGNENAFIGNDRYPIFEVGAYHGSEVSGKIIHFLACSSAFSLGMDLCKNGCIAFFGYDQLFVFIKDYTSEFVAADHALDIAISEGKTAGAAHDEYMRAYQQTMNDLLRSGVSSSILGFLEGNMKNFCSPSRNACWGDENASLSFESIAASA